MSDRKPPKKVKYDIWTNFIEKVVDGIKVVECSNCGWTIKGHATRMSKHMETCLKKHEDVDNTEII